MDGLATEFARRELEDGGWTQSASREPHPALRAHVSRYWGYVENYRGPMRRRELPSSEIVLVLSFGPELRLLDAQAEPGRPAAHTSFVAGLTAASVVTEMDGASDGMQVNFTPLGAYRLLGLPMHTVTNRVVALEDVLGEGVSELLERLEGAPSWPARFDILDSALRARLAESVCPAPGAEWAWRRLVESEGRATIKSLTDELGWSRKRLVAEFREQVGLPPKVVARILRFQRAVRLSEGPGRVGWAELAVDCGYFDQAHFNRDFKEFAGSTPSEFLARQIPDGLGLAPE